MEKTIRIKTKEDFGLNELEVVNLKLPEIKFNGNTNYLHFTVKLNDSYDFSNLFKFNEDERSKNYDFKVFEEIIFIITYPDNKIKKYHYNLVCVSKMKYNCIDIETVSDYAEFSIKVK